METIKMLDLNFKYDNEDYTVNFELYVSDEGYNYVIYGICDSEGQLVYEDMIDFTDGLDLNELVFEIMND